MNRSVSLATSAVLIAALSSAVNSAEAQVISTPLFRYEDKNNNIVTAPYFLDANPQNRLIARFDVPDGQAIQSLNSFQVFVTANDDADRAGESADVFLGVSGSDVFLGSITNPPNAQTVFSFTLAPSAFADAIASIQNNNRIPVKIDRTGGDMFIQGVTIRVDANLAPAAVPEPASLALFAGVGMTGLLALRRRRKQARP